MFKLKNISTKVLYLYRFDTLEKVTVLPNEIIEVLNILNMQYDNTCN